MSQCFEYQIQCTLHHSMFWSKFLKGYNLRSQHQWPSCIVSVLLTLSWYLYLLGMNSSRNYWMRLSPSPRVAWVRNFIFFVGTKSLDDSWIREVDSANRCLDVLQPLNFSHPHSIESSSSDPWGNNMCMCSHKNNHAHCHATNHDPPLENAPHDPHHWRMWWGPHHQRMWERHRPHFNAFVKLRPRTWVSLIIWPTFHFPFFCFL